MAATLSSTGTWTALTTPMPSRTTPNDPAIANISLTDFATPISEVGQIVKLVADGYNTDYWAAAAFLRAQLTSLMNGQVPRVA